MYGVRPMGLTPTHSRGSLWVQVRPVIYPALICMEVPVSRVPHVARFAAVALALTAMAWPNTGRTGDHALTGTRWRIAEVAGKVAPADARITFTLGNISGAAGCNRFFGSLAVTSSDLRIGPLMSTKMFCAGRMDAELAVMSALVRVKSASRAGEVVELRDESGAAVLRLVR